MGKGTIVSEQGAGEYTVTVNYETSYAAALIARLQNQANAAAAKLPGLLAAVNAANTTYQAASAALQAAIVAGDTDTIKTATKELIFREKLLIEAIAKYRRTELAEAAANRKLATIQANLPADHDVTAWCADFNEGLTGQVGMIEIGLIEGTTYVILPGGATGTEAAFNSNRDGQLVPLESQIAAQAFYNYAMLPGVAKWRPRYRFATVTAVDTVNDTVDVDLDAAVSTHQNLDINQTTSLSAVPADYMGIGAGLYEVGDYVIVNFGEDPTDQTGGTSWTDPHVIGFVTNPKPPGLAIVGSDTIEDGATWSIVGGEGPFDIQLYIEVEIPGGGTKHLPIYNLHLDWIDNYPYTYYDIVYNTPSAYPGDTVASVYYGRINGEDIAAKAGSNPTYWYSIPWLTDFPDRQLELDFPVDSVIWNEYLSASSQGKIKVRDANYPTTAEVTKNLAWKRATFPDQESWTSPTIYKPASGIFGDGAPTAIGGMYSTIKTVMQNAFGTYAIPFTNYKDAYPAPIGDEYLWNLNWFQYWDHVLGYSSQPVIRCFIQPSATERPTAIGQVETYHESEGLHYEAGNTWPWSEWILVWPPDTPSDNTLGNAIGFCVSTVSITY